MKTVKELMEWCIANSVRVSIEPGMVATSPAVKFQFDDMVTGKRWVMALDTMMFREVPDDVDIIEHVMKEAERNLELRERHYREGQRQGKLIIVHRKRYRDIVRDSTWIINQLVEKYGSNFVKKTPEDMCIDIFGVKIMFRSGDVLRCAGIKPDYYIASNGYDADYLAGRGGERLQSLDNVIRIVEAITDDRK